MAIYSLSHSTIGRTTHVPGTAGAHLGYITRASACRTVISEHIPTALPGSKGGDARRWLNEEESKDRKNARVIDKLMLALPKELSEAERVQVVRTFIHELAGGKAVPFFAAIHDKSGTKDADNPHAHLVIRDRCPNAGKGRVIGMSEKGSTERAREVWERVCNEAMAAAGIAARIDRRTLKEQGVERVAQVHEGPVARQIETKGRQSKKLEQIRWERSVAQAEIDRRKTIRRRLEREEERLRAEEASFVAAWTVFQPLGDGVLREILPSRALWMLVAPIDAKGAREILGVKEDEGLFEIRDKFLKASTVEKSSVSIQAAQSKEASSFEEIGYRFLRDAPRREVWAQFLEKLDDWGRRLISKLSQIVPHQPPVTENLCEKNREFLGSDDERKQTAFTPSSTGPTL